MVCITQICACLQPGCVKFSIFLNQCPKYIITWSIYFLIAEITIGTGRNDLTKIKCSVSIPKPIPVIPWYTFITEEKKTPPDKPFVKLVRQPEHVEHIFKTCTSKLKAVVIAVKDCNVKQLQAIRVRDHPPILIVPTDKLPLFNGVIESRQSDVELMISSVPLTAGEKHGNTQGMRTVNYMHVYCIVVY